MLPTTCQNAPALATEPEQQPYRWHGKACPAATTAGKGSGMKAHRQDQAKEKTLNHIKVITRKSDCHRTRSQAGEAFRLSLAPGCMRRHRPRRRSGRSGWLRHTPACLPPLPSPRTGNKQRHPRVTPSYRTQPRACRFALLGVMEGSRAGLQPLLLPFLHGQTWHLRRPCGTCSFPTLPRGASRDRNDLARRQYQHEGEF